MGNSAQTEPVVRFQDFQVNLETGEVWKAGVRLKLQDQPFKVLAALLQRPGQIVTREELRQLIWPEENFGDFDHAINLAITKLRSSLGDSADVPHLIETLPRRGYRFIAPVENPSAEVREAGHSAVLPRTAEWTVHFASIKGLLLLFSFLGFLVFAFAIRWWKLRSPLPAVIESVQITNDHLPKDVKRLVSDGTRLYFQESLPEGVTLVQVSTQGGETARIPVTLERPTVYDISPTRSELLVGGDRLSGNTERPLWVVPLPAGPPHRLGDILADDACWAPDGHHLVFVNDRNLFVANPDGSEVRKLATADGFVDLIRFSPDGTRLRFTVRIHPGRWDIMEIGTDGSGLHRLPIQGCCGTWSADGKYYFYQTESGVPRSRHYRNIWVLPERQSTIGGVELGAPVQLTAGPV